MPRTGESYPRSERAAKFDELVATYASRGARQRRQRSIRRVSVACGLATVIASGAILSMSDLGFTTVFTGDDSASEMKNLAEATRLAEEKSRFVAKIAELEGQIELVKAQKQDLENQQVKFAEQSEALARLLNDVGSEQADLEKRQQHGSQLDQEIAAIAAQRKALEQRWTQFEAQGELLAMEIVAVNAQRKELESQRQQIDRQQRELAELLQRAEELYPHNARSADADSAQDSNTTAVNDDTLVHNDDLLMVDNRKLDSMRGGFSTGEGFDVSFGFAQTGSLNGVDQYTNSFKIDSMASGLADVDFSNMNSVLLQNGSGNFVSSGVLDSLSDSFGTVIQNTLDDQLISTTTVYDIDLHNVSDAIQGIYGEQAIIDSLSGY